MKQALLVEPERIEIREQEQPVAGDNELLVQIAYCGVCTLEQRLYSGERKIYYPIVPGHEASGIIVEKGKHVFTHHQVGDHVALDLVNRCHVCDNCTTGKSNLCLNRFKKGQRVLGAFSEYMVVKPEQAFVISQGLALESAALSEPVACCVRSLHKLRLTFGENILVTGAGTMGLIHVKLAKAMGARVIVSDIDKQKLDRASELGADVVINGSDGDTFRKTILEATGGRGVDCCAITTSAIASVAVSCDIIADGGRLNIYTSYDDDPVFPMGLNTLHRREIQLTGSEGRSEDDFHTSVALLEKGGISVDALVSSVFPLEEANTAIQAAISPESYRVLLRMGRA
ncbi:MAG: zinc-dependent alcohol dehydrogenase [Spirochaetota bacterium]